MELIGNLICRNDKFYTCMFQGGHAAKLWHSLAQIDMILDTVLSHDKSKISRPHGKLMIFFEEYFEQNKLSW